MKDALFEMAKPHGRERAERGVLLTIAEKYWPTILRLYGDG